jgi:hypothetical protein
LGQQEKHFWKYLEIKVAIQGELFPRKSQKGQANIAKGPKWIKWGSRKNPSGNIWKSRCPFRGVIFQENPRRDQPGKANLAKGPK